MRTQDDKNDDLPNSPIAEFDPSLIEDVIRCSVTDDSKTDNDSSKKRGAK